MFEAVKAVLKAYFTAELLRSHGLTYGLVSMALWMTLFIAPIMLFASPGESSQIISGYAFSAVLVFMSYSMATWDWAWELRWLMMNNMLEHVILSGRSIFIHYIGIIPISFTWLGFSLITVYILLSILVGPPLIIINDPFMLALGLTMLFTVLFGHAMILGGTTIAVGTSGPIMEFIGWILPIATGGLTPLSRLPYPLQVFALLTPYSYPAEILRYGLLGTPSVIDLWSECFIGIIYDAAFIIIALVYFKYQMVKLFKEGPKTVGMY